MEEILEDEIIPEVIYTAGFYKYEFENLLYAPNEIISGEYYLNKEFKETYEYPVSGWYWFESEELAKAYFNIV